MPRPFRFRLSIGADHFFVASIIIFLILLLLIVRSAVEVAQGRKLEARTYSMIIMLEQLSALADDLDTDSPDLQFDSGIDANNKIALKLTLDSLRQLAVDAEQRNRLDTLDLLFKRRIDYRDSLARVDVKGIAADRIRANNGIRVVLSRAVKKALLLLSLRSASTEQERAIRARYFASLSILLVIFAFTSFIITRKNMKKLFDNKITQEDLIDELSYQNKQLSDFAHMTSHNLRGPAANISALISLINEESPVDEYKLIFGKLDHVSKNLAGMLNELLNVLHIKRNKDAEKVQLNFGEIFQKEKENLAGQILKSKAEVHFDFNEAPTMSYYRAYLESITHNLMSNALKYRSPLRDPVISVKTENRAGRTYLHVTDNGLGIDMARYGDQIFGLRKTFHEHPDARGIGLFMTKTQIEALGGRIQVQSVAGEGTTFTVEF